MPGENACGGGSELASQPGSHCGTCDQGVVACTGDDTTSCIDEDRGVNDCGGCHQLPGMVDFRCGGCDGSFICDGDNDLTCNTDTGSCGDTIHCEGHDVDPLTDDDHCGSCSNSCGNGASCDEGSCAAAAFLTVTIDEAASILDVEEGETLVIEAFVTNTGEIDATQDIVLKIDGDSIDVVSDVAVNASTELTVVTLQWATTTGDTGSYTAEVSSEDDVDSVTVTVTEPE